jgi:hypothetical protein
LWRIHLHATAWTRTLREVDGVAGAGDLRAGPWRGLRVGG